LDAREKKVSYRVGCGFDIGVEVVSSGLSKVEKFGAGEICDEVMMMLDIIAINTILIDKV
jgi:hypothetical protein